MLGWTLVHKPPGISSARALVAIKRAFGIKRVGHSGTLDPFADGLLLVCFGRATRLLPFVRDEPKIYRFTLSWGTETDTGDGLGQTVRASPVRPSSAEIEAILPQFRGDIMQTPPAFSALKVNGQRAYRLARRGKDVHLKPRSQHIFDFRLLDSNERIATFEVSCNRGTYIRTLAQDLARVLGTCGHLNALTRLSMGPFTLPSAFSLDLFEKRGQNKDQARRLCFTPQTLLDDIPVFEVTLGEAAFLQKGRKVPRAGVGEIPRAFCVHGGRCVALVNVEGGVLFPKVVLEEED